MHPAYFARESIKRALLIQRRHVIYVVGQTQIDYIRCVANKLEDFFCCFIKHLSISGQLSFCTAVR